jgi:hypothetical protein
MASLESLLSCKRPDRATTGTEGTNLSQRSLVLHGPAVAEPGFEPGTSGL